NLDVNDGGPSTLAYRAIASGGDAEEAFTEHGASHLIRFRKCSDKYLSHFVLNGRRVTKDDCPLIVANGAGKLTVYANTDSLALDAIADVPITGTDGFKAKHGQFTI